MTPLPDPYCYPGTKVLRNNLGILDKTALDRVEYATSMEAFRRIERQPIAGNFDYAHLCETHRQLFADVYPFAGQTRTIDLIKPEKALQGKSVPYSFTENIVGDAEKALATLKNTDWGKLATPASRVAFAASVSELWRAHPFREGNTRTVLAMTGQLCQAQGMGIDVAHLHERGVRLRDTLVMAVSGIPEHLAERVGRAREITLARNEYQKALTTGATISLGAARQMAVDVGKMRDYVQAQAENGRLSPQRRDWAIRKAEQLIQIPVKDQKPGLLNVHQKAALGIASIIGTADGPGKNNPFKNARLNAMYAQSTHLSVKPGIRR